MPVGLSLKPRLGFRNSNDGKFSGTRTPRKREPNRGNVATLIPTQICICVYVSEKNIDRMRGRVRREKKETDKQRKREREEKPKRIELHYSSEVFRVI